MKGIEDLVEPLKSRTRLFKNFEDNIRKTLEVIKIAKIMGCSVEAEVGYVKGNEPTKEKQIGRIAVPERPFIPPVETNIDEAKKFVKFVPVDMLAASVGTTHGVYDTNLQSKG